MSMRRTVLAWAALVGALAIAACSGGQPPAATPAASVTATTAVPTATPTRPLPAASPTPDPAVEFTVYPLPGATDLLVYTVLLARKDLGARSWPVRAVVVQDLAAGSIESQFTYSGPDLGYPVGVELAGQRMIVATEVRVTRHELDGSQPSVLFERRGEAVIGDIAVSPDGAMVAIATYCLPCSDRGSVQFVRVADGTVVSEVPTSRLNDAGFRGYAWQLRFRADGSGVFVAGGTSSEAWGGRATAFTDGTFAVHQEPRGYGAISPDGTRYAEGAGIAGACMHAAGRVLRVINLESSAVLHEFTPGDAAIAPWEWSPGGTELLYLTLAGPLGDACTWTESPEEFHLLDLATGAVTPVNDIAALHRDWYGDTLVEAACERWPPTSPVLNRWGTWDAGCVEIGGTVRQGDLFAGGHKIANWPSTGDRGLNGDIQPVGFMARP